MNNFLDVLVELILSGQDLGARQLVKDAKRAGAMMKWDKLQVPTQCHTLESMALAASLTELFCQRNQVNAPMWVEEVKASPQEVYLDNVVVVGGGTSQRFQEYLRKNSPECFRRRNVFTYPDYLDVL